MKPLEMVELRGQYADIRLEIDEAIREVLESAKFIRGPAVGRFECELAGYLDAPYVLGVGNGTDALQVAMMALGVGHGDEVITSAFTFIATAEAAALLGARVAFADIDPQTFNLDPAKVEALITKRTKVIVPVHLFGQPADMDPIAEVAARHGIAVIEDNAQSVGSRYRGRAAGLIGDIGTLSFFPSKNLGAYGDGGAVLTKDEALYRRMRMIASHGSEQKYLNEIVGVNSRLDTLQAAILSVKLRHLDTFNARRLAAAKRYDELLGDVPGITVPFRARRTRRAISAGRHPLRDLLSEGAPPPARFQGRRSHRARRASARDRTGRGRGYIAPDAHRTNT
jgi:dTDP-4-amino-4,6-dideoxygalactose transaminase